MYKKKIQEDKESEREKVERKKVTAMEEMKTLKNDHRNLGIDGTLAASLAAFGRQEMNSDTMNEGASEAGT